MEKQNDFIKLSSCLLYPVVSSLAREGWVKRKIVQEAPKHPKKVHHSIWFGREATSLYKIWRYTQEATDVEDPRKGS